MDKYSFFYLVKRKLGQDLASLWAKAENSVIYNMFVEIQFLNTFFYL